MFSEQFYSVQDGRIVISAPQASYFAKEIENLKLGADENSVKFD